MRAQLEIQRERAADFAGRVVGAAGRDAGAGAGTGAGVGAALAAASSAPQLAEGAGAAAAEAAPAAAAAAAPAGKSGGGKKGARGTGKGAAFEAEAAAAAAAPAAAAARAASSGSAAAAIEDDPAALPRRSLTDDATVFQQLLLNHVRPSVGARAHSRAQSGASCALTRPPPPSCPPPSSPPAPRLARPRPRARARAPRAQVTELGHADAFARAGRRFLLARWASEALAAGNAPLRLWVCSLWAMPQRAPLRRAPPVLSPYNPARLALQVSGEGRASVRARAREESAHVVAERVARCSAYPYTIRPADVLGPP